MSSRFRFDRTLPTALALILVLVAATACGSSSTSTEANEASTSSQTSSSDSAAKWSESFCTYAQAWETSLRKAATNLKARPGSKASASAALNGAKSATILFSQQLSTLGPPPGAQQAAQQLKLYGQRLEFDNQNLQGDWSAPAGNAQALAQKIATVKGTLVTMVNQLRQAAGYIEQLPSDSQLRKAFASNSTCTEAFAKN